MARMNLVLGVFALSLFRVVVAGYYCDNTTFAPYYPFCVNVPDTLPTDNCGGKLPLALYLVGLGGFFNDPTIANLEASTSYDGFGYLLANHRNGNTSEVTTLATDRFITVIPIPPLTVPGNASQPYVHFQPDHLDRILAWVEERYPVDLNRKLCVGYSAGSRGCWRYTVFRPGVMAASVNSAAGAETAGSQYILEQWAPPTFPLLYRDKRLPIQQFDGTYDTTAGTVIPQETQDQLVADGSTVSTLQQLPVDHTGLQTAPFSVGLLQWLLAQRKDKDAVCIPKGVPSSRHKRRILH